MREFLEERFSKKEYIAAALDSFRRRPSAFTAYVIRFEEEAPQAIHIALERKDIGEGLRGTLAEILEYAGAGDDDDDDDEDDDEDGEEADRDEWELDDAGVLDLEYDERENPTMADAEWIRENLPEARVVSCGTISPEALALLLEMEQFRGVFLKPDLHGAASHREYVESLIPAGAAVLGLRMSEARNKDLALLNHFPNLEHLEIRLSAYRDSGFAAIQALPRLKHLELPERTDGFSGAGPRHLHASPLEFLDIHGLTGYHQGKVLPGAETFEAIAGFTSLRELKISSNYFRKGAPAPLESLNSLRKLTAFHTNLDETDLAFLRGLAELRELSLFETRVGPGLGAELQACRQLRALDVHNTAAGDDLARAILEFLPDLEELNMINTGLTDEGVGMLASAPKLRVLGIGGKGLTDGALDYLEKMTGLKRLGIRRGGGISKEARARRQSARPDLEVEDISSDGHMTPGL